MLPCALAALGLIMLTPRMVPESSAAQAGARAQLAVERLSPPVGEGSTQPNLSVDDLGNLYLIWQQRRGTERTIQFSRFDGSNWTDVRAIGSGTNLIASSADLPSIISLGGSRLAAHWLQGAGARSGSYGVRLALSDNGGDTWGDPVVPHAGHETGENGFVSLYAAGGDSVGVIWLDGRQMSREPGARHETMLMSTRVASNGGMAPELSLDDRVCDCCQTSQAMTSTGPIIAYRDRSPAEIRDISVVRLVRGSWTKPVSVHDDGWFSRVCPVNGPAIDATGSDVAVAWFTNARDTARVLISFSSDAGEHFGTPVRIDAGAAIGKVSVRITGKGEAWVSWMERTSAATPELRLRRVNSSGSSSPSYVLQLPTPLAASSFPQLTSRGDMLYLTWTAPAGGGSAASVAVGRVRMPAR